MEMEKPKDELEVIARDIDRELTEQRAEEAPAPQAGNPGAEEEEVPDYVRAKNLKQDKLLFIRKLLRTVPGISNREVHTQLLHKYGARAGVAPDTIAEVRAQEGLQSLTDKREERLDFVRELLRDHEGHILNRAIAKEVQRRFKTGERMGDITINKLREELGFPGLRDLYGTRDDYVRERLKETKGDILNRELMQEVRTKFKVGISQHRFMALREELGVMSGDEVRIMRMKKPHKERSNHSASPPPVSKQTAVPTARTAAMSDDRMENGLYRTIGDLMARKGYRTIRFEMNGTKLEVSKEELRETKTSIALKEE